MHRCLHKFQIQIRFITSMPAQLHEGRLSETWEFDEIFFDIFMSLLRHTLKGVRKFGVDFCLPLVVT